MLGSRGNHALKKSSVSGRWVRQDAVAQRLVSGWALEIGPSSGAAFSESGSHPPGSPSECSGGENGVRWWIWSRPGHTPVETVRNERHVVIFDGRIDDRSSITDALGLDREEDQAAIVLAAFSRWGCLGLGKLIGEFALAVLDRESGEVWLSIDRGGVGEIVWWQSGDGCIVATSDAGLLHEISGPLTVDLNSALVHLEAKDLPPERSFCVDVGQMPPDFVACLKRFASPSLTRYPVALASAGDVIVKFDDAVEAMAEALRSAASDRLRSGPGAMLLSGGVDSSVATAAAQVVAGQGLVAAIAFASQLERVDERVTSGPLAKHLGLRHLSLDVDNLAPYCCSQDGENWRDRLGAPGPFDPFRIPFGEAVEAGYAMAAREGASVVWGGDRGDLVIGERNHSALRPLLIGIARRDPRLFQLGAMDLRADFGFRGARSVYDHMRPLVSRLRPMPSIREDLPDILRQRAELQESRPAYESDPLARRWVLWRSPSVDRCFRVSSYLARRHGLRVTDPWSDVRVISTACKISQSLINPPGSTAKQLGQAVAEHLLGGWRPNFCQNGIVKLWVHGTRGDGAATILDLASEQWLEEAGVDGKVLASATQRHVRNGDINDVGSMQRSWDLAWWHRAYGRAK